MKLVTYAITPKLTVTLKYKYANVIVDDPLVVLMADNDHHHHIINILDLTDEQAAKLSGGTAEP